MLSWVDFRSVFLTIPHGLHSTRRFGGLEQFCASENRPRNSRRSLQFGETDALSRFRFETTDCPSDELSGVQLSSEVDVTSVSKDSSKVQEV